MKSAFLVYDKNNPAEAAAVCSSLRFAVSLIVSKLLEKKSIEISDVKQSRARLQESRELFGYKIIETPINTFFNFKY